jgi:bifunctional non-homologous end joining protein LigD
VIEQACRMGLEGIVAKRVDAPYRSGRQHNWVKLKCTKSDTFPIVAFVEKLGARPRKIALCTSGAGKETGSFMPAQRVVVTPNSSPARCASGLTR